MELSRFVEQKLITAFEIPGIGIRFRADDLDSMPTPISPEEAASRLFDEDEYKENTVMPSAVPTSNEPVVPLKVAAEALGMPYKTLLGLAYRGTIPATDLNAGRGHSRHRFMVCLSAVRKALQQQAEQQAATRRAPPQAIDLLSLAGQPRRRR